ncbi:hypothetical protein TNCV_4148021 [Trichonephila clavipes]|nr:hypothetical protein TNCV_4148021 [Trichonephila clavipes]
MKNQWSRRRTDGRISKIANGREDEYPNLALDITRPIQLALDSNGFDYCHLSVEIETHHLPTLLHGKLSSSGAFYRIGMERGMAVLQDERMNTCLIFVAVFGNTMDIGDGHHNFESWSKDDNVPSAVTLFSNYHSTLTGVLSATTDLMFISPYIFSGVRE